MPLANWNIQWQNQNSQRRYPLADDATGLDQTETFALPNDFLLELDLPVTAGVDIDPGQFYLKHVSADAAGYSLIIGYQPTDAGSPVNVATAIIPRQAHVKGTVYNLGGIEPFADTQGKVVVGRLDNIDQQPPGFWTFDFAATRLDPDAIRPTIRGVSAIVCVNGNQRSTPLQGIVELVAGSNCRLDVSGNTITVNFIQGEGTVESCVCDGAGAATQPITSINGVPATADNNFTFLGSDCVQFVPIAHGLRLVNPCAKPCCGCAELERITTDLTRLNQQATTVDSFLIRLETAVETMNMVVLGSRLSDRPCVVSG